MTKINNYLPLARPFFQDDSQSANNNSLKVLQNTNTTETTFNLTRDSQAELTKARLNNLLNSFGGDDTAKYLASKEFSQLDPIVQESIKKNLETVKNDPQSVKNFIELAKSGGFRNANKDLQSAMLNSLAKRPQDKIYREALQEAVGRDDFKKLAQNMQAKVIEDLEAVLKLIMASIGEASGVSLLAESSFHSSG